MSFFDTNRLIFGGMLLLLIAAGEIVLHELQLPSWPVFFVMVFFFLSHMDSKVIPKIICGAVAGLVSIIIAKPLVTMLTPIIGLPLARLSFILGIVALIILFREHVGIVFNDYFFAYFLLGGMASRSPDRHSGPFVWMAVAVVGGLILVYSVLGIRKITEMLARKRAVAEARTRLKERTG
jgi:hypothetical protein